MATAQRTRPRAVVGVISVATKIYITSQRQRSAACNNFLHFLAIIAGDFLFMNNNG